jgi:hypothetical protein
MWSRKAPFITLTFSYIMKFVNKLRNGRKRNMSLKHIAICLMALIGVVSLDIDVALARQPLPDLRVGMSYGEVAALYGAADEKIERETKREELWRYSHTEALFRNGRIVSWHRVGRDAQMAIPVADLPVSRQLSAKAHAARERERKIPLTDILNEVEQSTPGDASAGGVPGGGPQNAFRGLPPPPDFANQVQRMAERGDGE